MAARSIVLRSDNDQVPPGIDCKNFDRTSSTAGIEKIRLEFSSREPNIDGLWNRFL